MKPKRYKRRTLNLICNVIYLYLVGNGFIIFGLRLDRESYYNRYKSFEGFMVFFFFMSSSLEIFFFFERKDSPLAPCSY